MQSKPRLIAISFIVASGDDVGEADNAFTPVQQLFVSRATAIELGIEALWLRTERLAQELVFCNNVVREPSVARETT